eukprot:gene4411-biopygen155
MVTESSAGARRALLRSASDRGCTARSLHQRTPLPSHICMRHNSFSTTTVPIITACGSTGCAVWELGVNGVFFTHHQILNSPRLIIAPLALILNCPYG